MGEGLSSKVAEDVGEGLASEVAEDVGEVSGLGIHAGLGIDICGLRCMACGLRTRAWCADLRASTEVHTPPPFGVSSGLVCGPQRVLDLRFRAWCADLSASTRPWRLRREEEGRVERARARSSAVVTWMVQGLGFRV